MSDRCHDWRIFRRSSLNFPEGANISRYFASEDYHILGDSAYELKSYLMIPFKDYGNMSENQRRFNRRLARCRSDIERCFGR